MRMDAFAWKSEYTDECEYKIQVNNIKHSDKGTFNELFKEWEEKAVGWSSESEMRVLARKFKNDKEWLQWAKSCPIKVVEVKYRAGTEKYIQHSCKTRKKRAKNGSKTKR